MIPRRVARPSNPKPWPKAKPSPEFAAEIRKMQRGHVLNRMAREIGRDPYIDEVIARNADVHVEVMSDSSVALIVDTDRETVCYFIGAKNGKSHVTIFENWRDREKGHGWRR